MAVKRTYRYLQVIKYNGLVFNSSKKLVVDCYADDTDRHRCALEYDNEEGNNADKGQTEAA